ncbi:MAG: MFS transporter [Candidatus Hydrogenedentota bacterium]
MGEAIMKKNYPVLLVSQFLGAFGDNAVLAVILGQLTFLHLKGLISETEIGIANAIYTSLLFIPYILLAPYSGFLNDRFAKTDWLLGGNIIKLAGSIMIVLSLISSKYLQGLGYLIIGIGACIYSPAKYGILPEILPREQLVKANGTIEMLTIVAILSGTLIGARIVDKLPVFVCYLIIIVIYLISSILILFMQKTPKNLETKLKESIGEFYNNLMYLITHIRLSRVLLGTAIFWVCGACMKMNMQPWGLQVLKLETNTEIAYLGLWLSFGIMAGSILSGQLHKIGDLTWTRRYGWLLAILLLSLGFITRHNLVIILLLLAGSSAGLFLIPLNAVLQAETSKQKMGKTIATQNFIENIAMIIGGILIFCARKIGLSSSQIFIYLSIIVFFIVYFLKFTSICSNNSEGVKKQL